MNKVLLSAHKCGTEELLTADFIDAAKKVRNTGVDLIEFDVRVTKDKRFVTWHDRTIMVKGKNKAISRITRAEFLSIAKESCTLEEILHNIKGYATAHVDLKDARCELEIVDLCKSIVGDEGFIITTLYDKSVRKIRSSRPSVRVGLSIGRPTNGMSKIAEIKIRLSEYFPEWRIAKCKPNFLAICYMETGYGALHWAKYDKLPVLLWTIDNPTEIRKAWNNPLLWAFTTNRPLQALELKLDHN